MEKFQSGRSVPRLLLICLLALSVQPALAAESASAGSPANAKAATTKEANTTQDSATPDKVKTLESQVADQQAQIEKLTRAVELLTDRLNESSSAGTAESKTPATPAGPAPVAQVTSLTPVIPAGVSSASTDLGFPASQQKPAGITEGQTKTSTTPELQLSDLAYGKIKIGATVYASFSHFTNAGFAPAFQDTPTIQLPPGNDGLNAFEVGRAYINLIYAPNEHVTLRITPDIYRQADNSYSFRLKYAYFDLHDVFGNGAFKKSKLTFGQTQNPLVDWEEGLTGYRFVYLMPWNYISLSSTYAGIKMHGPIELNGKEYLDYDFGVFNTASFHSLETNDKKQVMGRVTWYPMGTKSDRTGFGITVFDDYGYNTKLPSEHSTALNRFALIGFYQSHDKAYEVLGEYDLGHNAAGAKNVGAPGMGVGFDAFSAAVSSATSGEHTRQEGYSFFGKARLGKSPFQAFGMFQRFKPNTNFDASTISLTDNPGDIQRFIVGVNYSVTKHFSVAFGNENFRWVHPQTLDTGGNTNGIVAWTQFNY